MTTHHGKLYVWEGTGGRWYWRHVARNGREDNGAEQGYASKAYAKRKARNAYPGAPVHEQHPLAHG